MVVNSKNKEHGNSQTQWRSQELLMGVLGVDSPLEAIEGLVAKPRQSLSAAGGKGV